MRADSVKEYGHEGIRTLTSTVSIERWARAHLDASSESRQKRSSTVPHFLLAPLATAQSCQPGIPKWGR